MIGDPTPTRSGKERLVWLDLLRFAAIMLVLGAHMDAWPEDAHPWIGSVGNAWKLGGWTGVDLFFVLSGFLVSGLLFAEIQNTGTASVWRFLIRRGFKIYPAFWVVIGFTIAYRLCYVDDSISRSRLIGELLFLQNYLARFWDPHWSLAVEEHFYFLLAIGVAATLKWGRPGGGLGSFDRLPSAFLFVALACLMFRWSNAVRYPFDVHIHLIPTHLRIDSLFFGVLLAWGVHSRGWAGTSLTTSSRWLMIFAGLTLYIPPFVFSMQTEWWVLVFGVIGLYVGAGLLVMAGQGWSPGWPKALRIAAFVGAHSYSIYLWHFPFLTWINPRINRLLHIGDIWWLDLLSYLLGSILLGIGMSKLIEWPLLRIRDRYFPSDSGRTPPRPVNGAFGSAC